MISAIQVHSIALFDIANCLRRWEPWTSKVLGGDPMMTRSTVGVLTRVAMIYVNLDARDERPQLPPCVFGLCVKGLNDLRCKNHPAAFSQQRRASCPGYPALTRRRVIVDKSASPTAEERRNLCTGSRQCSISSNACMRPLPLSKSSSSSALFPVLLSNPPVLLPYPG